MESALVDTVIKLVVVDNGSSQPLVGLSHMFWGSEPHVLAAGGPLWGVLQMYERVKSALEKRVMELVAVANGSSHSFIGSEPLWRQVCCQCGQEMLSICCEAGVNIEHLL